MALKQLECELLSEALSVVIFTRYESGLIVYIQPLLCFVCGLPGNVDELLLQYLPIDDSRT